MKKVLMLVLLLGLIGCDLKQSSGPFTNPAFNLTADRATIQIEQKNFLPGTIMKVICSGLDDSKEYKVFRKEVYGEEIGKPRFIRKQESATRRFRVPPKIGKYVIKLLNIDDNLVVANKYFFVVNEIIDPEDPVDPPVDPPTGDHVFKLEIMTDKYAQDNSWKVFNNQDVIIAEGPTTSYENNKLYSETIPVENGNYRLEVYDSGGDGLRTGAYVKCYLDGKVIFKGRYWFDDRYNPYKLTPFRDKGVVKFRAGPGEYVLTDREKEYLDVHNRYRKEAHEAEGLEYVPLRWNKEAARLARAWAEYLASENNCGLYHEQNTGLGENLAARTGNSSPRPIEGVVASWVNSPGHYYQLKWRGSHYMGCGEAYGDKCSVQACRFISHGNCNGYDNWIEDFTYCTSICPPEGCYIEN